MSVYLHAQQFVKYVCLSVVSPISCRKSQKPRHIIFFMDNNNNNNGFDNNVGSKRGSSCTITNLEVSGGEYLVIQSEQRIFICKYL